MSVRTTRSVWCGGMPDRHSRARQYRPSRCRIACPGDVSASNALERRHIEPEAKVSPQGTIAVNDEPGRGCRIREIHEKLTSVRRRSRLLEVET
jgi:hypothetical protein